MKQSDQRSGTGRNPYRTTSIPYNPAVYEGGNNWTVMDIAQVYPRGTRDGVYADIFLLDDVNDAGFAVGSKRRYGLAGSLQQQRTRELAQKKMAASVRV